MSQRKILLHYHLFKNAGSSVDRMLKESFGDCWANYDKSGPGCKISSLEMAEYIEAHPELRAVSSHQVVPPLPVGSFEVMPVVFLRDPIDRIKSAYLFEWQKQLHLDKPKGTLAEYINQKLQPGKGTVIANFQVSRLSNRKIDSTRPVPGEHELERLEAAKEFLLSIPFFGLVERFEQSWQLMADDMSASFAELDIRIYRENASRGLQTTLVDRYRELRKEIGDTLFEQVIFRNHLDLQLYSFAAGVFEQRLAAAAGSQLCSGAEAA